MSKAPAYRVDKPSMFKMLGYQPTATQNLFHDSEARFRVACCGRRFGKTTMVANDRTTHLLLPKQLGWIVGPTYDLGMKEFRVMWDNLIIGMELGKDKRIKKSFNVKQGDMYIEFPWGSRVEVRSAAHPDKLVGDGLDWVIISEAAKQDVETWEKYVRPALADKRGGADFVTTPEGKNWLYKLWLRGRGRNEEYESWRFPSWMNEKVFPGGRNDPEIKQLEETTLEEWFMQEIGAEFTAVVGRIFGEFAEDDHVMTKKHEFNPAWPNYIAFDWGFTAPLAAMEFQVSPRDEIFVWREHYETNRTLEWHINELKNREQPPGYHLDLAFGDAADPEAVEYVSQHLVGCMAEPDSKQWLTGIRLMKDFMKLHHDGIAYDEYERPIMRPRYHVDPSCEEHIGEILGYRARKGVASNEFTGAGVVDPKVADHSIDAMRYGLMHLYKIGVQHHLNEVMPVREQIRVGTRNSSPQSALEPVGATGRSSGTFFNFDRMTPGGRF